MEYEKRSYGSDKNSCKITFTLLSQTSFSFDFCQAVSQVCCSLHNDRISKMRIQVSYLPLLFDILPASEVDLALKNCWSLGIFFRNDTWVQNLHFQMFSSEAASLHCKSSNWGRTWSRKARHQQKNETICSMWYIMLLTSYKNPCPQMISHYIKMVQS